MGGTVQGGVKVIGTAPSVLLAKETELVPPWAMLVFSCPTLCNEKHCSLLTQCWMCLLSGLAVSSSPYCSHSSEGRMPQQRQCHGLCEAGAKGTCRLGAPFAGRQLTTADLDGPAQLLSSQRRLLTKQGSSADPLWSQTGRPVTTPVLSPLYFPIDF